MEIKDIMDSGYMIVPVILFVGGLIISWNLGSLGINIVGKGQNK